MEQSSSRFPVPHKKLSLDIKGNKTVIVICSYDDHMLVMASQIGSMGTILHARKEEGVSINPTFSVSVILGKRDEPMLVACGRQLIEHMRYCRSVIGDGGEKTPVLTANGCLVSNSGSSRPLVLSLGLKDHSMETLRTIVSNVIENRLW